MSNLETLLTAWLTDGEVPEDFEPETRIEEYLVAILNGVDDSVLNAIQDIPQGGAELNIAFGDTAPEDTSKLWIKAARTPSVTVDYDPDNTVETVYAESTVLPDVTSGLGIIGVVGKKCYIFRAGTSRAIDIYDTEAGTLALSPASFQYAQTACGVVGTKIYSFGGGQYSTYGSIIVYDTENDTLTTLPVTLPSRTEQSTCGVVGKKCYIFGGVYNGTHYNTIEVFDTETNTVSTLSATLPTAARAIGVGVVGTKIYLFGGATSNGSLDTINVFDTETNTISTLSVTLPIAAGGIAVATYGTKCYLLGGGASTVYDTIRVFDTETETLTTLTETLPQTATGIACGVVGTDAYLFGGWTGTENTKNINKFNITFPLAEGAVFVHEDMLRNQFTLVKSPSEVKVGVAAVSRGNANGYAENCEAYLHDGTEWRQI